MFLLVATYTENKRRLVVVELGEMMQHERDARAAAELATSAHPADPSAPDLLQRVATKDATGGRGSARSRPTASARA